MTFDSRIVKTSTLKDFDTTKTKKPAFPLKTVMTEKSVYVLDGKGKVEKKISLKNSDKTAMSDDGLTIATLKGREITLSRSQKSEVRSQKSDLKSREQIVGVVKIADPQPVVLPQHVFFDLSPNGSTIVVLSFFTHNIYFHNRNGKLIATHHVDDLRGAKVKFSKNSKYAAIHMPNWGKGKTTGYLLFFNTKGEKLWRFDHKGCQAKFDISSESQPIVIAAEDRLYSLDKQGKVVYEKELIPGDVNIALSVDGKYVAVTRTQDLTVSLLNNADGRMVWTFRLKEFDTTKSRFTSLDISNKKKHVAASISKDWAKKNEESFLYVFDTAGNTLWQKIIERNRVEGIMSPQGSCVMVKCGKYGYLYKN